MKVYIAALFSRRAEMRGLAGKLERAGITVTSSWLFGQLSDQVYASRQRLSQEANKDLDDIEKADILLSFTEDRPTTGGGRHVEFGYALALKKRLWIVGPFENIFHHLMQVRQFDTFPEALKALKTDPKWEVK